MRVIRVKKCKRVGGLSFDPHTSRLLVLSGYEAFGIETAVWIDTHTGVPTRTLSFTAEAFLVAANHSRLLLASHAYGRSELAACVRWLAPDIESEVWHSVKIGARWTARTTAVAPFTLALTSDGTHLVVGYGCQRIPPRGLPVEWTYHVAICPLAAPSSPEVIDLENQVFAIAVSSDGTRWAASTEIDGRPTVVVSEHPGGPPLARYSPRGVRNSLGLVGFSPDGRSLAVVSGRHVHLLTADELAPVMVLEGHRGRINDVVFSPDGRRVLTAAHDGLIRTWDAASGEPGPTLDWQLGPLVSLAFAPDGLTAAAGGLKGQVVIWDVDE